MERFTKVIQEHPFFSDLDSVHVDVLSKFASEVSFYAGQTIYQEGEIADCFLLIRHGRVAVQIYAQERGSCTIQTLGPGDVLGWSWLFPPYRRRFDARALELTRAVALDGKRLREKAEEDPRLGYALLKRFSRVVVDRLHGATLQILNLSQKGS
ncbi:MAG: cyclic nucleotide-binding domain-containing protein [Candidatus Desulfacyla sp.]